MATFAPVPYQQFIGSDALPVVSGSLYTYAAGTSTPLTTYQDAAETLPNTNPVVLDTFGQCSLALQAGVSYKFELRDALGALLWTQDNVQAYGLMAYQSPSAVAITGGSIAGVSLSGTLSGTATNVTGVVAVINGGTGATTAAAARTSLGAAASGANTDITSLQASVTVGGNEVGYLNAPQTAVSIGYTLLLTDAGKHVSTSANVVIPSNAVVPFPIGTIIGVFNNSASAITLSITSDTLRLAGTASTGSRTLAQYGYLSLLKVGSTTWVVTGAGLT